MAKTNQQQSQTTVQFTSEQIRDLKSLGIKIAVPSYVPDGFRIDQVQAIKDDGWGPSWGRAEIRAKWDIRVKKC